MKDTNDEFKDKLEKLAVSTKNLHYEYCITDDIITDSRVDEKDKAIAFFKFYNKLINIEQQINEIAVGMHIARIEISKLMKDNNYNIEELLKESSK